MYLIRFEYLVESTSANWLDWSDLKSWSPSRRVQAKRERARKWIEAATTWQREGGKPRRSGLKPRRKRAKRKNITTDRFFTIMIRGLEGSLWREKLVYRI